MMKTKTLTEGTPWKQILLFSIPIFWGNVFQLLYSLVDTKIVGSTLGTEALAAVGSVSTLHTLMTGFLNKEVPYTQVLMLCYSFPRWFSERSDAWIFTDHSYVFRGKKQEAAEKNFCSCDFTWCTDYVGFGADVDDFPASGAESAACAAGAV